MSSRRQLLQALLCGGLSALAGCGYHHAGGELKWRKELGKFGWNNAAAVDYFDGQLLTLTEEVQAPRYNFEARDWFRGGEVTILDSTRGSVRRSAAFEGRLKAATTGPEGGLYVWQADGTIRARMPDGGETDPVSASSEGSDPNAWSTALETAPKAPTTDVLAAGVNVYAAGEAGLAALSPDTGAIQWRWEDQSIDRVLTGHRETVLYAIAGDRLLSFSDQGDLRWADSVGEGTLSIAGVDSDGLYVADATGLTALTHNGEQRWRRRFGSSLVAPRLVDGHLYYASSEDRLHVVRTDGETRWSQDLSTSPNTPVIGTGTRAFVNSGTTLSALSAEGVEWEISLVRRDVADPSYGPFLADGAILLVTEGEVRAYWQSQLDPSNRWME